MASGANAACSRGLPSQSYSVASPANLRFQLRACASNGRHDAMGTMSIPSRAAAARIARKAAATSGRAAKRGCAYWRTCVRARPVSSSSSSPIGAPRIVPGAQRTSIASTRSG